MINGADQPDAGTNPAGTTGSEAGDSFVASAPFFQRIDWLSFGLTAVVVLVVYLSTLAPEVTLQFSGILSASAKYAGVAHPPGFPVWTLYSWLFIKLLPFSNVASRVAAGSAVAAALACGVVALMVSSGGAMLLRKSPAFSRWNPSDQNLLRLASGYVGAMALGLSSVMWRKAVIVDIWALSVLLFGTMLCLLMRWVVAPGRRRYLYGACFVFGLLLTSNQELIVMTPALLALMMFSDHELGRDLSLPIAFMAVVGSVVSEFGLFPWLGSCLPGWYYRAGNVWQLFAMAPVGAAAAFLIVRTRRFGSEWKSAILCLLFLLLGLGCYFYLPIASMTNPPSNWGYARTVEGFFHLITRGQYERPHPTDDLGRFISQLWMVTKETWRGFGWPYLLLVVQPFCVLRRAERCARNWMLGLTAVCLCVGPLMVALLNPAVDLASVQFIVPYFAAAQLMLAVWTGLGVMVLGSMVVKPRVQPRPGNTPSS